MIYKIFISIALLCTTYIYDARAHGSGVTLDKTIGDYIINVDYDAVSGIYASSPVQFVFELFNNQRSEQLDFTHVWVSISSAGTSAFSRPIFDGGIIGSSFPPSSIAFAFPSPGAYTLTLRYDKDDKTLAEASFPLDVLPGETSNGKGFFNLSGDVFKGALSVGAFWFAVWIGRRMLQKK